MNERKQIYPMKFPTNYSKLVFLLVVGFAAFGMAAYKINLVTDNWQDWIVLLGLEALRASLVLSNIGIRKINIQMSYWALAFSAVATLMLSFMSHFHVVETLAAAGKVIPAFESSEWWMLQTINLLLLFCEWSMSVLIAGHMMNWEAWTKWIESDFVSYFDQSTYDSQIADYIKRVVEKLRVQHEFFNELGTKLGVEGAGLSSLSATVEELLEKVGEKDSQKRELEAQIEQINQAAANAADLRSQALRDKEGAQSQIELLSTFVRTGKWEGNLNGELLEIARFMEIGSRVKDTRLSIGNNEYEVHCSGQEHTTAICPPYRMKKGQKTAVCPACGKAYSG